MRLAHRIAWTVVGLALVAPAQAADKFKLGYMATLSGPGGITGTELVDGLKLALAHLGGKIGGLPTDVIIQDDQQKPDVARQIVEKFIISDKVDAVAGVVFSNLMLAIYGPVIKSTTILVSSNAGPSEIAGKDCAPYFFSTSWQGDNYAEAMGAYLQAKGVQNIYLMAPNYAAGHDVLTGFKRYFKGKIADEVYTPLSQLDFAGEMAQIRAANPTAVFVFYPGGLGIQFVKQYSQAGLKDGHPLYTAYTVDNTTLPAIGDDALGLVTATFWNADLDNPVNKRFVADFVAAHGHLPAEQAAQAYDTAMLLDSGVRGVDGKIEDKAAFIAALAKGDFKSVRGKFRFNTNHFPIQNFYLEQVVKGEDGKPRLKLGDVAMQDHGDAYAAQCPMK